MERGTRWRRENKVEKGNKVGEGRQRLTRLRLTKKGKASFRYWGKNNQN